MIFITGGSYQGKLAFAQKTFDLRESDIFICTDETQTIHFEKRCVAYIDRFALNRVCAGAEPLDVFRQEPAAWRSAIILSTDVSCGVVPVDAKLRAWREACGRMNNYLAQEASQVWRLFCGLPQRLK